MTFVYSSASSCCGLNVSTSCGWAFSQSRIGFTCVASRACTWNTDVCALALALVAAAQALAAPRSRRGALRMSIAPSDVVVMICA